MMSGEQKQQKLMQPYDTAAPLTVCGRASIRFNNHSDANQRILDFAHTSKSTALPLFSGRRWRVFGGATCLVEA